MSEDGWFWMRDSVESGLDPRYPHACNCVGCCTKCGGCITNPNHARTCSEIARLNAERDRVYIDSHCNERRVNA